MKKISASAIIPTYNKKKNVEIIRLKGLTQLLRPDKRGWSYEMVSEYLKESREVTRELVNQKVRRLK